MPLFRFWWDWTNGCKCRFVSMWAVLPLSQLNSATAVARMWRDAVLTQTNAVVHMECGAAFDLEFNGDGSVYTFSWSTQADKIDKLCHDFDSTHWKRESMPISSCARVFHRYSHFIIIELNGKRNMILFTPFLFSLKLQSVTLRRVGASITRLRIHRYARHSKHSVRCNNLTTYVNMLFFSPHWTQLLTTTEWIVQCLATLLCSICFPSAIVCFLNHFVCISILLLILLRWLDWIGMDWSRTERLLPPICFARAQTAYSLWCERNAFVRDARHVWMMHA